VRRIATRALPGLLAASAAAALAADGEKVRVHVVQPGESLSQIAAVLVRDAGCWPEIYRANRDQIKDPAILHPGQRLVIPAGLECRPSETAAERED
jgi:nucleoid-associated protein YgaU